MRCRTPTVQLDAVLFDLDDTLCRYRRSGSELLAAAFERTGRDPFITREEYHDRYPEFVDESESMRDLRKRCFAAIAEANGRDPEVGHEVAQAYAAERDHGNVEALAGIETVLRAVERQNLPSGVVTNGSPGMQSRKLETLGLEDAFDVIVHAGYDAPAKPDPEPFRRALTSLEASADRTVHVGDSLDSDVAGARAAGLEAVWVAHEEVADLDPDPMPDYTIESIAELPTVLGVE